MIREKNDKAGGVEYDSAEHTVAVIVTDNGDGTLSAKTELKSRNGEDAKDTIVFKNSYTAQPASVTLGASKAYVGGELEDGQFTFELKDKDGNCLLYTSRFRVESISNARLFIESEINKGTKATIKFPDRGGVEHRQ